VLPKKPKNVVGTRLFVPDFRFSWSHSALVRTSNPHFSPVVCSSAGYIRHYGVALGRAPERTAKYAFVVLAASTTLRHDNW
jgi:hypothetical protein